MCESCDYAPTPFVHASIGQKWEGAYTRDRYITVWQPLSIIKYHMRATQELELKVQEGVMHEGRGCNCGILHISFWQWEILYKVLEVKMYIYPARMRKYISVRVKSRDTVHERHK